MAFKGRVTKLRMLLLIPILGSGMALSVGHADACSPDYPELLEEEEFDRDDILFFAESEVVARTDDVSGWHNGGVVAISHVWTRNADTDRVSEALDRNDIWVFDHGRVSNSDEQCTFGSSINRLGATQAFYAFLDDDSRIELEWERLDNHGSSLDSDYFTARFGEPETIDLDQTAIDAAFDPLVSRRSLFSWIWFRLAVVVVFLLALARIAQAMRTEKPGSPSLD